MLESRLNVHSGYTLTTLQCEKLDSSTQAYSSPLGTKRGMNFTTISAKEGGDGSAKPWSHSDHLSIAQDLGFQSLPSSPPRVGESTFP